jgi:GDPmannose 4,6-dehydratase
MGNLDAKRDWGFAGDYVVAMWLMLQQDEPEDYVIATGKTYSVKDLLEIAFSYVGLNWQNHVVFDEKFYRPTELYELRGDAAKAKRKLGWKPALSFEKLIHMMIDEDLRRLEHNVIDDTAVRLMK